MPLATCKNCNQVLIANANLPFCSKTCSVEHAYLKKRKDAYEAGDVLTYIASYKDELNYKLLTKS